MDVPGFAFTTGGGKQVFVSVIKSSTETLQGAESAGKALKPLQGTVLAVWSSPI